MSSSTSSSKASAVASKLKRPAPEATAEPKHKAWRSNEFDGGAGSGPSMAQLESQAETKAAVSSIKSKLSKPKELSSSSSAADGRKQKIGSFSAGLTRDQILASQQQHREKLEANGKQVPTYKSVR